MKNLPVRTKFIRCRPRAGGPYMCIHQFSIFRAI